MKKLILPFSILALLFTSCSSDDDATASTQDPFIGTWSYYKYLENGVEQPLDPCENEETIVVSENGDFSAVYYDDNIDGDCVLDETFTGTWSNSGNSIYDFTGDEGATSSLITFEGNTFYFIDSYDNGTPDDTSDDTVYKDVYLRQ